MKALPDTDPDIYQEFSDGNWLVNKNSQIHFCWLGAWTKLRTRSGLGYSKSGNIYPVDKHDIMWIKLLFTG